ncbi:MAG: hypothetical protein HZC37_16275 [Burkholderiales bacterium]|nr:hypothetical protein [Burkholderiales bacterium]
MHKRQHFKLANPAWDAAEEQWMDAIAAGGALAEPAWLALFEAYGDLFVRRLEFWSLPPARAEEETQELWLDIARGAVRYERKGPVRSFLRQVLWHKATHYFDRERKVERRHDSLADEATEALAEEALQLLVPSWRTDDGWPDFRRCVHDKLEAFEQQHPRLARLLVFMHVEELTLEETASLLGGDALKAKAEVFSARRKFGPLVKPCLELWPNRGEGKR